MKKRVKAMALVCIMAIISCKTDVYAAKQTKLETIRVIKEIKGSSKISENINEISTLKWTIIRPYEAHGDIDYVCKYNKSGLVREFDNKNSHYKYLYIVNDKSNFVYK